MGTFKDLGVWQDAVQLAVEVYELTESFPRSERYGSTAQTRRAAVSISSNIAEGKGGSSKREPCRFLYITLGSLYEVQSQLEVALALEFIPRSETASIDELPDETGRSLTKLKRSIES